MRIEFSMPMMNYGIITVENAIDGGFAQPLEYKIDVSDFDVTIEGLRAASLLMSQKSTPAKQFNLDEIIESNMYKKTSSVESLRRRNGSKFQVAYDQDGYSIEYPSCLTWNYPWQMHPCRIHTARAICFKIRLQIWQDTSKLNCFAGVDFWDMSKDAARKPSMVTSKSDTSILYSRGCAKPPSIAFSTVIIP